MARAICFEGFGGRRADDQRVDTGAAASLMRKSAISISWSRRPAADLGCVWRYPVTKPVPLDLDQLHQARHAKASWRSGPAVIRPDRPANRNIVIEVMLGTRDRIRKALAPLKRGSAGEGE